MDIRRLERELRSLTEDRDNLLSGKIKGGEFQLDKVRRQIAELEDQIKRAKEAAPQDQAVA